MNFGCKFVGLRSFKTIIALPKLEWFSNTEPETYGKAFSMRKVLQEAAEKKIVFLGEIHSVSPIIQLQKRLQTELSQQSRVNIILEHFSFEMQDLLDRYQAGEIDFEELVRQYEEIGTEGHRIESYYPVLEQTREPEMRDRIHAYAGFIPRTYARLLMREGEDKAVGKAKELGYLPQDTDSISGTEEHYNLFEAMITQRRVYDTDSKPSDQLRKVFQAQLLKDHAMAFKINQLLKERPDDEKFLVVLGKGHMLHSRGVPERVFAENPKLAKESMSIVCQESDVHLKGMTKQYLMETIEDQYGPEGSNPGDVLFVYETEDAIKLETQAAYDKVGETAHLQGNHLHAAIIMSYLGYSESEFECAGEDAYNYQGVGNPHKHARIKPGETVLDVGSGLGIDSFIAEQYAGSDGRVIGIDLSKKQVEHARFRASERGSNVEFLAADMEKIPLPDSSIDVVISNGAFCLAPNKEKAFSEIYRVLKPGGRMSVFTSTVQQDLETGVDWPACMRMFIHKSELIPLCERVGFQSVLVDDSDSLMQFEIPVLQELEEAKQQEESDTSSQRHNVHIGSPEFRHLEAYDMNQLCARVCVVATKPEKDITEETHGDQKAVN